MTQRSKDAIAEMNNVQNTPQYPAAAEKCEKILAEERRKHVEKVKAKLATLKRGSKQWWRINDELLHRKGSMTSIPPLREDGHWISDAKENADAFARTFAGKSYLPDEAVDTPYLGKAEMEFDDVIIFRSRATRRLLKKLDEKKATGGDM